MQFKDLIEDLLEENLYSTTYFGGGGKKKKKKRKKKGPRQTKTVICDHSSSGSQPCCSDIKV